MRRTRPSLRRRALLAWKRYRRIKLRLNLLLIAALPFSVFLMDVLPRAVHNNAASLALAACYLIFLTMTGVEYGLYRCIRCRKPLRGCQLFNDRCSRCGVLINPSRYY